MHDIHDKGYKKLFSNRTIFRQLLETFVVEDWVQDIDFTQCVTLDKSFVSDHYKETESDLIYKLTLRGKEAYVIILLEFQSTVERFMAVRMLNYITNFYMDYVETHSGKNLLLPPVFPIVLYNGKDTWTAPVKLARLIKEPELLGRFRLDFEYCKIVEREFPKQTLLRIRNVVSTLFLAESYYDVDLLIEEFGFLFENEEDREAFWLLVNWFLQLCLHERIDAAHYEQVERAITTKEEMRTMITTAIEQDRQQYYEEGRQEGRQESRREVAKAMLMRGMVVSLITEITGFSEDELRTLREERDGDFFNY